MNPVLLGAIIAAASSVITKLLDHLLGRDSRRRELLTERYLDATEEAYWRAKVIASIAGTSSAEEVYRQIIACDEWFFRHCMHFPKGYANAWLTLRNRALLLCQRESRKEVSDACTAEITNLRQEIEHWARECLRLLNAALRKPELAIVPWAPLPAAEEDKGEDSKGKRPAQE